MDLKSVGQVIATRSIKLEGSTETAYLVKIGLPQQFPDKTDFFCPVQIDSASGKEGNVSYSAGIDSVQALQLSMVLISGILSRLNRELNGKLRWEGGENGDLGFPVLPLFRE